MPAPIRLTAVMTHPVQYVAPWFRHIAAHCGELDLTVLYATAPTPEQQGAGFGQPLAWDVPLLDGYRCRVVRAARPGDDVRSDRFRGVDVPEIAEAVALSRPDVALVPGWHSVTLARAIRACRRRGVPVLYRGDSHLGTARGGWRRAAWSLHTRWRLAQFSAYLAVGNRAHTYLRTFGVAPADIFASPHAVDNERFARAAAAFAPPAAREGARRSLGIEDGEFAVALVGKLAPVKRPLDLVRALARLGGDARLLVVGAGALDGPVAAEAARGGVRVARAGFVNQSELGRAYAAADCLALPGQETWGLVVNEALASGRPAVVSDRVGSAPDLVVPGRTGEVFPWGDVAALAAALARVRDLSRAGHDWAPACRARAAEHSFARATEGLLAACRAVTAPLAGARRVRDQAEGLPARAHGRGSVPGVAPADVRPARAGAAAGPSGSRPAAGAAAPRVIACCGDMVVVSGRERLTFEVLRALRERGAAVHAVVNRWENHRIVALADAAGAVWSTGHYATSFDRHARDPRAWLASAWDVACTSLGLARDAWRLGATHVLVPGFDTALRNAPALLLLRALGRPVVLRVATHPAPGRVHRAIWSRVLPPLVTCFAANSDFAAARLVAAGVPARKVRTIYNAVAHRAIAPGVDDDVIALARRRPTLLSVGQIAPFKGTHLVVEAALALSAEGHDVQAIVLGRAPVWPPALVEYLDGLRGRVAAAGAEDRVIFAGEAEDVPGIMRASHLLVAPIVQEETFGNVVLEARSAGLPVVAFATGGVVELVEHGVTGYLCPEPSLASLLEGLRFYLNDPARREQAAAASRAASAADEARSAQAFAAGWWALLDDLRPARGSGSPRVAAARRGRDVAAERAPTASARDRSP